MYKPQTVVFEFFCMDKLRGDKDCQVCPTLFIYVLFDCPWIEGRGNHYQIVTYNIDISANNVYIIKYLLFNLKSNRYSKK